MVLHGLGGDRGVEMICRVRGGRVLGVAYDARGHADSGGSVTLAGPREVAELRALRKAYGARGDVSDTKIGAWGIPTAAARSGTRSWPACPSQRSRSSRPGPRSTSALAQDLARSVVAGLAAPSQRGRRSSPASATTQCRARTRGGESARGGALRAREAASARSRLRSTCSRAGSTSSSTSPRRAGVRRPRRPEEALRRPLRPPPSTFPGRDRAYVLAQTSPGTTAT